MQDKSTVFLRRSARTGDNKNMKSGTDVNCKPLCEKGLDLEKNNGKQLHAV